MPQLSIDRELDELLTVSAHESRYVDLALRLRRPLVDFQADVPAGFTCMASGVELITVAGGRQGVPVASVEPGESSLIEPGVEVVLTNNEVVGKFNPTVLFDAGGRWTCSRAPTYRRRRAAGTSSTCRRARSTSWSGGRTS